MSRAPGKYVAGTMAPAGAALDRPVLDGTERVHTPDRDIALAVRDTRLTRFAEFAVGDCSGAIACQGQVHNKMYSYVCAQRGSGFCRFST
jgi:hypothetical protein